MSVVADAKIREIFFIGPFCVSRQIGMIEVIHVKRAVLNFSLTGLHPLKTLATTAKKAIY
jgi:hypothetical protein